MAISKNAVTRPTAPTVEPTTPTQQDLKNIGIQLRQMGEIAPTTTKLETLQDIYGNIGTDIGQMGDIGGTTNPNGALTGDQINEETDAGSTVTPQQQTMNDYEEWYKANVGTEFKGQNLLTKPAGMDYATWATGQTLYNLYEQSKLADESLASNKQINNEQSAKKNSKPISLIKRCKNTLKWQTQHKALEASRLAIKSLWAITIKINSAM